VSRKVLITTLPLNANYGGILQAYALQRVVRDVGFRPVTDTSRPKPLLKRLRWWLLRHPYRWVRLVSPARVDRQWRTARRATASLRSFVARNIETGSPMEAAGTRRGRAKLARRFRTFVVGSDQVWRAAYANIPAQFLDVLEPIHGDWPRRISFAASFGVDDITEYSEQDRSRAATLIRRFDAISVRETAGVEICRDAFGVHAERHVDPTMVLRPEQYEKLFLDAGISPSPAAGRLLVYGLDANDHVRSTVHGLSERLGLPPLEFLPAGPPSSYREYVQNAAFHDLPSIEQWLACFASADFVVTDSFHGCAFSILFNRPFVVLANEKRGVSRFTSLLSVFGLEHHLVTDSRNAVDERVFAPDWTAVNGLVDAERARAIAYLRANL
jgi:hypothetical protein